jgi:hypothetical protein
MIEDGTKFLGVDSSVPTPENRSSQANGLSSMVTIEQIAEKVEAINGGSSGYTETIVDVPSEQILAMGTTPIVLLPAAGANAYYDIEKIIFEYSFIATPYALVGKIMVLGMNTTYAIIKDSLITEPTNMQAVMSTPIIDPSVSPYFADPLNVFITLTIDNGNNPTDGDGTLRVKIYHKTITFGA